ncbi:hypothetical protein FB451DRAFT_1527274 [Mycena latifolia]|nr:hypothetical protein FB451DRAFT_1527274 [Mycena latifolia]
METRTPAASLQCNTIERGARGGRSAGNEKAEERTGRRRRKMRLSLRTPNGGMGDQLTGGRGGAAAPSSSREKARHARENAGRGRRMQWGRARGHGSDEEKDWKACAKTVQADTRSLAMTTKEGTAAPAAKNVSSSEGRYWDGVELSTQHPAGIHRPAPTPAHLFVERQQRERGRACATMARRRDQERRRGTRRGWEGGRRRSCALPPQSYLPPTTRRRGRGAQCRLGVDGEASTATDGLLPTPLSLLCSLSACSLHSESR